MNAKKNLTVLSLTAAMTLALVGPALAAGQSTVQPSASQTSTTSAPAPAPARGKRAERGAPSAEASAQMKAELQTRVTELLAQSGSNAQAVGWLRQAQTLLSSNDVAAGRTAMSLIHAAEGALGVQPQQGGGRGEREGPRESSHEGHFVPSGEGRSANQSQQRQGPQDQQRERDQRPDQGPDHHLGGGRTGEQGRTPPSAEQLAQMQADMKTHLQTRVTELLTQSGSNAQATGWLRQAQTLLSSNDAAAGHTAMSLIHAAEGALGVASQPGERHGRGESDGGRQDESWRGGQQSGGAQSAPQTAPITPMK